jgi:hypothetical protein
METGITVDSWLGFSFAFFLFPTTFVRTAALVQEIRFVIPQDGTGSAFGSQSSVKKIWYRDYVPKNNALSAFAFRT